MSDCSRTVEEVKSIILSSKGFDSQQTAKFYDSWAQTYEQDVKIINYRASDLGVDFLNSHFSGNREEVQVLDVACGSGMVSKLMVELGFRHFVGVDGSKGMLEQAAKTGLYQDLRLALLGTEPLPAQTDTFDVVIIVGALDAGFAPVGVVRELCHAAKPGGLVCMARGEHTGTPANQYKKDLERELQLMEEEGLWSPVGIKQTDRYMEDPHLSAERAKDMQEERYISGTVYLYKKSIH
ncbi:methyltransferase-like protein 27 [Morone saxatilis]|uniref:methyltransferase-like protein 27 n=1 Tax=Morone saxatilis TaxID=34816 RepID=UPI0015E25304|nr:methyltransferase-like protein 27 [Morone saxatilis]